jgi:hypothetical protein
MGMHLGRTGSTRALRSRLGTALGLGSAAVLVAAGVALVGVLPAAAFGAESQLVYTTQPPTAATVNVNLPNFAISVEDSTGAVVTNSTDSITIASTCGLSGTQTVSAIAGVATFTGIKFTSTGSACTITEVDNTTSLTSPASNAVNVTTATPTKIAFTVAPPANSGVGVALTPAITVSVEQANGIVDTSAIDNISITSTTCTLGGTTTVAAVAGVATFGALTINSVGNCYLIATDTTAGYAPVTASSPVVVSGGTPEKVAFTVAPPASVAATATLVTAFKASVEDASGNVDTSGAGSTDSIALSSPCLAAPVSVTAVAGVATFSTIEFASTGSCTLTATDASRVVVAALATVQVGTPQAAITVTSKTGYLDAPLTLAATGGTGTGALTFSVTNGTATGCLITSGALSATKAGTCIVTATKAAVAPYATGASAATTVTISGAPHAVRLVGTVARSRTTSVTVTGYNFSGRPKVISNVAGFTGLVTKDTGKSLTIRVTVKGLSAKPGVKTLALTFANGAHASVKYSLH